MWKMMNFLEDIGGLLQADDESTEDLTQVQYELLSHPRYATRTLELVAITDIDKYLLSSSVLRNVYQSSFAKSAALWNNPSRSTVAADQVEEIAKRKLLVPTCTRWNSYYNAVAQITENPISELNELCVKVEVRCFSDSGITFLNAFCTIFKKLFRRLHLLQSEDDCFFGTLLPTSETVIKKVKIVKAGLSFITVELVDCIENAIKHHFQNIFEKDDSTLNAIVVPKFK